MTLEEAIMKLDLIASDAFEGGDANEFRQLAEWMRELKELRELLKRTENRVHPACSECKYMKAKYEEQPCRNCCNNYRSRFEREVNDGKAQR